MSETRNEKALVSICVVSYNSADTILETLNSIFEQTYKYIELIISDDCSKDNTLNVVETWLVNYKLRFVNTQLINVDNNTGVTANCNRAVRAAKGEFIKIIAADDVLMPSYCNDCVSYFDSNPKDEVMFTKLIPFLENDINHTIEIKEAYWFFNKSLEEQFLFAKKYGIPLLPTPGCFYRKSVIDKLNYFDERFPMWEDGPMYFKLLENGIQLKLLDKEDVYYRLRSNSLWNSKPKKHMQSVANWYLSCRFKYEIKIRPLFGIYHFVKYYSLKKSDIFLFKWIYLLFELPIMIIDILKNDKKNRFS